ncbi:hypothetical protein A4X13_0g3973 [Tilletia indica]|uniref:Uncharacterized protein n=1 Tax=Tilletia indica TaxID=43049 RepID=A0A177TCW1_9BASI|nr:hypothetical protein A4X13_0g3973 [Tilletia indica]
MDAVSLRLFRSLRTVLPYHPAGDTVWVVVEDAQEFEEWMVSIPGKWNVVRRDRVGGEGLPGDQHAEGQDAYGALGLLGAEAGLEAGNDDGQARPNAAGRAAAAAALLTADMLLWRHRYQCDHAGQPQSKPLQDNLSPSKRRRRLPSIKVGCKATVVACQPIGERRIYIKWKHQHIGHDVASMQSVAESRLPKRVRDWIVARVAEGRDWKAIRNLLRLGEEDLQRLERSAGVLQAVPEALRIRPMDVYNELRRQLLSVARKADNRMDSLQKWSEDVNQEGGIAALNLNIPCADSEHTWAAYFMTSWQLDMLLAHGQQSVVSMDSTHNTCFGFEKNEKVWLYSLVVRSTTTGHGIPVAFMLTNGEAAHPIIFWLEALRRHPRVRFQPRHIMIDCSVTEVSAIRNAFPAPSTPIILFCDWHMLKAMTANSKLKVKGHAGHPRGALSISDNQQAQRRARDGFIKLMNASTREAFASSASAYLVEWQCCPDWVKYVEDTWLTRKEMWARAWRQEGHRGVDTNNFIESWHNQLKTLYLGLMRKQGVDVLLWFLLRQCVQDYRTNELRVSLGFQACALSKSDREANRKATALTYAEALALVSQDEDGTITIDSFTASGTQYQLQQAMDALGDEHELVACTCPAFLHSEFPCKHMWLAHRVLGLSLAQFSRKVKASVTPAVPTFSVSPPNAAAAVPAPSAVVQPEPALRVRSERNQAIAVVLAESDKIANLTQQLRRMMVDPVFICSRDNAIELGSRLEVVRHLMTDVLAGRNLHDRQQ